MKINRVLLVVFLLSLCPSMWVKAQVKFPGREYVVLVSQAAGSDASWAKVVRALSEKHDAVVYTFQQFPGEKLEELRASRPRYVAIVEKPENLSADYVKDIHRLSRQVDDDPYEDFLWGIITGNDAESAMRMVKDAQTPLVVTTALNGAIEVKNPLFFEKYAMLDPMRRQARLISGEKTDLTRPLPARELWTQEDSLLDVYRQMNEQMKKQIEEKKTDPDLFDRMQQVHQQLVKNPPVYKEYAAWKERERKEDTLSTHYAPYDSLGYIYMDMFEKLDPHFILGASPDYNIFRFSNELSQPTLRAREGKLCINDKSGVSMSPGKQRRVYLATGSDGGAVYDVKDNMALTWMGNYRVGGLAGYFCPSIHGQAAWGSWKMWMATPGRLTFPEAIFLNQQLIISRLNGWNPDLIKVDFPAYRQLDREFDRLSEQLAQAAGMSSLSPEQVCYMHERDILVYYGDPKWEVRLDGSPEDYHFKVRSEWKGKKYVITIRTDTAFRRKHIAGDYFLEETDWMHTLPISRLPFVYFFPERLKNPKVVKTSKLEGEMEMDENFLFIHHAYFDSGKVYKIVLSVDE